MYLSFLKIGFSKKPDIMLNVKSNLRVLGIIIAYQSLIKTLVGFIWYGLFLGLNIDKEK